MKPVMGKKKSIRGRITCHTATIGPIEGQGETPGLAVEACDAGVMGALKRLHDGVKVIEWRGHVAIVAPDVSGWAYWIDTGESLHFVGSITRDAAIASALHHLAQNVWTPDVADDGAFLVDLPADVVSDMARWIGFQRRYAALRADGKTDVEAHRLACG
jgi:hypothetical protein